MSTGDLKALITPYFVKGTASHNCETFYLICTVFHVFLQKNALFTPARDLLAFTIHSLENLVFVLSSFPAIFQHRSLLFIFLTVLLGHRKKIFCYSHKEVNTRVLVSIRLSDSALVSEQPPT